MTQESLRELLTRVHDRLRTAGAVDPESRKLLAELMDDIDRTLKADADEESRDREYHVPRLESFAVQFEADHPALAQQLRQLADILGKAGI